MEEKTSIKKLKEMIKEYLIAQEDRTRLIIDGWKYEENEYEMNKAFAIYSNRSSADVQSSLKELEDKIENLHNLILLILLLFLAAYNFL